MKNHSRGNLTEADDRLKLASVLRDQSGTDTCSGLVQTTGGGWLRL